MKSSPAMRTARPVRCCGRTCGGLTAARVGLSPWQVRSCIHTYIHTLLLLPIILNATESIFPGHTALPEFVLWKAGFAGLKWDSQDSHIVQESETGQVALNLRRHRGLLNLGRKLFEDDEFVKQIVYGDKDIFRFMFLLARMPYFFVPELYGYAVLNRYGLGEI